MRGELGIKVKKLEVDSEKDFLNPYDENHFFREDNRAYLDLRLDEGKGDFLYMCGENDWGYLLVDALSPLIRHGLNIMCIIDEKLEEDVNDQVEAILLGKNEYRAVDILYKARYGGTTDLKEIGCIPVIKSKDFNCIELLKREKKGE